MLFRYTYNTYSHLMDNLFLFISYTHICILYKYQCLLSCTHTHTHEIEILCSIHTNTHYFLWLYSCIFSLWKHLCWEEWLLVLLMENRLISNILHIVEKKLHIYKWFYKDWRKCVIDFLFPLYFSSIECSIWIVCLFKLFS